MSFKRGFIFSLIAIGSTAIAFVSGYYIHASQNPGLERFPILDQAYRILLNHALEEPPSPPTLEYGMIQGMIQAYGDPYTIFVEPAQHELESNSLAGKFGGIGVDLSRDQNGHLVLFPIPNSPAEKAGILEGDRLIAVEALEISPETPLETVQAGIRGPEGEAVRLVIAHPPDFEPVEIRIKRESIPLPSVTWHLDPDRPQLGVIQINVITASTPNEIQEAVDDLQARGGTHFVLDLRDNGGGLLSTGVETARLFLREGMIIQQQYRGQGVESFNVEEPGPLADIPLAVLVNHGTASAAEIIAGALQAQQRARLVGSPTFGKYTIQLVFDLKDGSSLHVTAGRWWIPELNPTGDGAGLRPDVPIAEEEINLDSALAAASEMLLGGQ